MIWKFDKRGLFSVKSAYRVALAIVNPKLPSSSTGPCPWWKRLWKLNLPSKVRIFCWKACKESIGCAYVVRKFIVTAWVIWHSRNVLLFGKKDCVLYEFWCRAGEFLSSYVGAVVSNDKRRNGVANRQVWATPLLGCYKMNVDAALAKEKSRAGLVCRNDKGVVIGAAALVFDGLVSVEVAKAMTILEGLLLAMNNGWLPLCI
ncbi:hypothetical protein Q3G72_004378 [Acer saccharum]|nr:hypothetical protein Q3G72_004378 [Acer saccharum]